MKLSPEAVSTLVSKAFCLESIADKKDCTSRHIDLDGRPLEAFIIAGINVAPVFGEFAADWAERKRPLFDHFVPALQASNLHKTEKYVNFGLLEIMFPAVAARLHCDNPRLVVREMLNVMKSGQRKDVQNMIAAREVAWGTSTKHAQKTSELRVAKDAKTPYEFYKLLSQKLEGQSSSRQWSLHYVQGLPWLQEMFDYLQNHSEQPVLERIKNAFDPVRERNEEISIGILADMCAAALFLHLSFQN